MTSVIRTAIVVCLIGGAWWLSGQGTTARARASGAVAKARQHFERGETLYRQGDFRQALAEYKKALGFKRYPAFIFNIAQCHRQLGEHRQALFFYKLFLSEKPAAPNRAEVLRWIKEMEAKVAALQRAARQLGRLSIITRPRGAQVLLDRLDGAPVARTPTILEKVKAGEHLVVIRRPGYHEVTRKVTVTAGQLALLEVELKPLVVPRRVEPRRAPPRRVAPRRAPPRRVATPAPVVRRSSPFYKRWWFYTGLAAAAGLVAGSVLSWDKAKQFESRYNDLSIPLVDPDKTRDRAERMAGVADGLWVGAVLVGVSTIIGAAVVGMGRVEKPKAMVTPTCGPTGCGLFVHGRF